MANKENLIQEVQVYHRMLSRNLFLIRGGSGDEEVMALEPHKVIELRFLSNYATWPF